MVEQSLLDFADEVTVIEGAAPVNPQPRVRLGPSFSQIGSAADFFRPRTRSLALCCYDVRDVTLHGRLMILLKDGVQVSQTNYCIHPLEWENAPVFPPPENRKLAPADMRVVIGANRNFSNHYHWLAQAVPAIDHAFRAPSDLPLCVALPDACGRLHADTLRLLGLGDVGVLRVSEHETYQLPFARYTDFLTGRTAFEISHAAQQTFRKLSAAVPDVPTGHDVIYVARTDTPHRKMLNETALIELLRSRGVSIVLNTRMTLELQINLFRNARVVIGAHGAGMANIAFCRPDALVYELTLASYPNACCNLLAQASGLEYVSDAFSLIDQPGDLGTSTWEVDLKIVESRLEDILRRGSAPLASVPPALPAQPRTPPDGAAGSIRLGVGVVTFNRLATLLETLGRIKEMTGRPFELIVADDGSTDGTAERLREDGVPLIVGRNMGVAWNKNRALFHLCSVKACDVAILLEDDTMPSEQDWQERWVAAALRWGHVNIAGEWFHESFVSGRGTPEDPILSKDVSAQCSAYTRECLAFGGYMDPRFHGFGFEHVEHSWRLARYGFGGDLNLASDKAAPLFKLISGGLHVRHGQSTGSAEQIDRNRDLCHRIMWDEHFRAPWSDEAEMRQFREELASVGA